MERHARFSKSKTAKTESFSFLDGALLKDSPKTSRRNFSQRVHFMTRSVPSTLVKTISKSARFRISFKFVTLKIFSIPILSNNNDLQLVLPNHFH
jgi:hypothetical protein